MQAVTDQPQEHVALNGWTIEAIAHTLLRDDSPETDSSPTAIAEIFALLDIETVVPDLSRVVVTGRRPLPRSSGPAAEPAGFITMATAWRRVSPRTDRPVTCGERQEPGPL